MEPNTTELRVRRVYEPTAADDGLRALIDRLWPRGLRREDLVLDAWWKDLTPSDALRRWVHADRDRWPEFCERYRAELEALPEETVRSILGDVLVPGKITRVTLLTAVRDIERSHVPVLEAWLRRRLTG